MKLSTLQAAGPFALLGPGFGNGRLRLLGDLEETALPTGPETGATRPRLVFAPFETAGSAPRSFAARACRTIDLELDGPARPLVVTLDVEGYDRTVARIRDAIAAGDVYQVCYTVKGRLAPAGPAGSAPLSGAELMRLLCAGGVPRFAAWVRLPGGDEFVSASPELFFAIEGRQIRAEPMKGTALAGAHGALEASDKDRAELAMITDLLRNDLARVCRPGTVRVACPRRRIALPYAVQTVSDVIGELPADASALDALAALHPGGSVTGAPKQAALSLIRDLEKGPRGAYCGALGLLEGERATFSLLIRTAAKEEAGWVFGVGGGIVWDSDAATELAELHVKLGALRCDTRCYD